MFERLSMMWWIEVWLLTCFVKDVNMAVTITAYEGTAISQQEPLTMTCNYTKDPRDFLIGFNWFHNDSIIATGTFSPQSVVFQSGTQWAAGVFLGDFVSSLTIQLPAPSVDSRAAGNYTCKTSSFFGSVQDSADAFILETQTLSGFPSLYKQIELSNLHIDCSSFINQDTPTQPNFTWTHKGEVVSSTPSLSIIDVERSEGGYYTCTVNSSTGVASGTVDVVIEYKPHISGQNAINPIPELSTLNIDCSSYTTEGNPSNTSYTWTGPSNFSSSGPILSINRMRRNQTGRYICAASNTLTPSEGSQQRGVDTGQFNVLVQYLDNPYITLNKRDVMENESVTIGCSVNSSSMALLTVQDRVDNIPLVQQYTHSLQYTIPNINCLQNGPITCTATNIEIGETRSASTELNVWCSPRLDKRHSFTSEVYSKVDEIVSLVVRVIANPAPVFSWYKDNELLPIGSREHTVTSNGQMSTLKVTPRTSDDYGRYAVIAYNTYGRIQVVMDLAKASCIATHTEDRFWTGVGVGIVIVIPIVIGLLIALYCVVRNRRATTKENENEKSPPVTAKQDNPILRDVINIRL